MKNFFLLFILLGLVSLSQINGQSYQKYQRPKLKCNIATSTSGPSFAEEGRPVRVILDSPHANLIRQVEVYIGSKYVGRRTTPLFYWWLNTKNQPLAPGRYKIKFKILTKCGNRATLYKDLQIAKLR